MVCHFCSTSTSIWTQKIVLYCLDNYYSGRPVVVVVVVGLEKWGLRLAQPSLAWTGTGAELGNIALYCSNAERRVPRKCGGYTWKCGGYTRKCGGYTRKCGGYTQKCGGYTQKCGGYTMCKPIFVSNPQPSYFGLLLDWVAVAWLGFGVMTKWVVKVFWACIISRDIYILLNVFILKLHSKCWQNINFFVG